jgi:hypothetical protein
MKILDIPRSGSVAGTTSSHNRAGQYVRNRRTPTNAPTARRTAIRTAFGSQSSAYSALTPANQLAWIAAAATHPVTDALGQSITLTGHQLFVAINTQLLNCGGTVVTAPPASFSVFSVSGSTASFSVATGIAVTVVTTGLVTDHILFSLSKPVPGGRSFWNTFQQNMIKAGNAATISLSTAGYAAVFGTVVANQRVFMKLTPVAASGVTGVPLVIPVTVVP